jgi:hypothetical protein
VFSTRSTMIGASLIVVLSAAPAPASAATSDASALAVRGASGSYDVTINGETLATVTTSDPAYTLRVAAHPSGTKAAVITDFDGTSGTALSIVSKNATPRQIATSARITSAAWSGDTLAFVSGNQLHLTGSDTVVGLPGVLPTLLGWASARSLVVQTYPGGQHDAAHVPSLSTVDVKTGAIKPILTSDAAKSVVYRDFRLTTIKGRKLISFVKAQHVYPCAGDATAIGLADLDGTPLRDLATTTDSYRSAVFSADGTQVAVEKQACVTAQQRSADKQASLDRLEQTNGVYVIDVTSGADRKIVTGLSANFPLARFEGNQVKLVSSRFGERTVDAGARSAVDAEALDRAVQPARSGDVSVQARINPNQFVHQLWDTRDEFNGNSACGPTSAVMDLAGYQLATGWGIQVSSPWSHWSNWGLYITNTYSNRGTTFNRTEPDASGRGSWTGAYGWMVLNYSVGTYWNEMTDYLSRNGAYVRAGMYDANWIRARINEGYMVVTSGNYVYGRFGHIALITGYTDDGRFYVNDPYGNGTDGSFDGQNSVYTWDYIQPKQFWAA